jgi:hypothetical protein
MDLESNSRGAHIDRITFSLPSSRSAAVALSDNCEAVHCEAVQEEEIDHLSGFAVCQLHALWANFLPCGNHLTDDRIDGLASGKLPGDQRTFQTVPTR